MPGYAQGLLPPLLSQIGAFKNMREITPGDGLIPCDLIVPFWSDGAAKRRWISVSDGKIKSGPAICFRNKVGINGCAKI